MKKLFIFGCILFSTSTFADISATTTANDATTNRLMPIEITGEHHINIVNRTPVTQTYHYIFTLCADSKRCDQYQHTLTASPGQNVRDDYRSHITVAYRRHGSFTITATTECSGGDHLFQQHRAMIHVN